MHFVGTIVHDTLLSYIKFPRDNKIPAQLRIIWSTSSLPVAVVYLDVRMVRRIHKKPRPLLFYCLLGALLSNVIVCGLTRKPFKRTELDNLKL